jgi:hypothetical protein
MPTPRSPKLGFRIDKLTPQYVTEPSGKVVAVLVAIEDWIKLLEYVCDLEHKLRPTSAQDRRLDAIVRKQLRNKKQLELDDIGFIGTGRAMTEAESLLVSAHIQRSKAKRGAIKYRTKRSPSKRTVRSRV